VVSSLAGTAGRITVSASVGAVTVDIASTYIGQASITTLGTITTGVWNGTAIANANLANSSVTYNGVAVALGASGTLTAAPSGSAGGDLSGTYPNPALANIPAATPAAGSIVFADIAAPASPSAAHLAIFGDSTDLRFHDKNAAGTIGTTVVADAGAANNFLTAISAAGIVSKAQPAASNLSNGVTGSGAVVLATAPAIAGGSHVALSSLGIRDTSAAFDVTLQAGSSPALTAGRNIVFNVVNAIRGIKLAGDLDIAANFITSGANSLTLTTTGATNVTLPTSGTLVNSAVTTLSSLVSVGTLTTGGAGTGFVLGGVTVTLGSDATGDTHYRDASGIFTRLATPAAGSVLVSGTTPAWSATPSLTSLSFAVVGASTLKVFNGGAGNNYGFGIQGSELQAFAPTGTHISFNGGGDINASGTNEIARFTVGGGLTVAAPTGGNKGSGTINAAGAYYANGTIGQSISGGTPVTIAATGGIVTTLTFASDERLKTFQPFRRGLADLRPIQPIRWHWDRPGFDPEPEYFGFSGQNVMAAMPETVRWIEEDQVGRVLSLDPWAIVGAAVNAINELHERLSALEAA
jgi:hypothetical protein